MVRARARPGNCGLDASISLRDELLPTSSSLVKRTVTGGVLHGLIAIHINTIPASYRNPRAWRDCLLS
jgi:hypothetical protein